LERLTAARQRRLQKYIAHFGSAEAENALRKAQQLVAASGASWSDIASRLSDDGRQDDERGAGAPVVELARLREEVRRAQTKASQAEQELRRERGLLQGRLERVSAENEQLRAQLAEVLAGPPISGVEEMELIQLREQTRLQVAAVRPRRNEVAEVMRRALADPALAALSIRALARRLGVSPQTVFNHRHRIAVDRS
jgi:hypothetical protein